MKTKGNEPWSARGHNVLPMSLTRGFMCHKVIVTVGRTDGGEVESWMGLTAKGGVCCLTAMGCVMDTDVTLNLAGLSLLQKSLQGSIFGGGNPQHDIPAILELYKLGQINLDDVVTREYRLEQVNDGYRDMLEGRNHRRCHPIHRRRQGLSSIRPRA